MIQHYKISQTVVARFAAIVVAALIWQSTPVAAQQEIQVSVEVLEQVTFAPREDGFIVEFEPLVGQELKEDQVVIRLDGRSNALELKKAIVEVESLELQSEDRSEMKIATAKLRSANENLSQLSKVSRSGITRIPTLEMIRAQAGQDESKAELGKAKVASKKVAFELAAKQAEVKLLELQKDFLTIRSPFPGNIAEVFKYRGDFVAQGTPIATVYRLDQLAGVALIGQRTLPIQSAVGKKVSVEIGGEEKVLEILRVSPRVDAVDSYRAFFKLENAKDKESGQWLLFPGVVLSGKLNEAS